MVLCVLWIKYIKLKTTLYLSDICFSIVFEYYSLDLESPREMFMFNDILNTQYRE